MKLVYPVWFYQQDTPATCCCLAPCLDPCAIINHLTRVYRAHNLRYIYLPASLSPFPLLPLSLSLLLPTHLSILIHFIISQLDLLEGDNLFAQSLAAKGAIRMGIETSWRRWICLAGDKPRGPMICIAIAFRVHGDYVQQHSITIGRLNLTQWARE